MKKAALLGVLAALALFLAPKLSQAAVYGSQPDASGEINVNYYSSLTAALGTPLILNQTTGSSTLTLLINYSDCYLHIGNSEAPTVDEYSDSGYSSFVRSATITSATSATPSPNEGMTGTGLTVFKLGTANFWHFGEYYRFSAAISWCGDRSRRLHLAADTSNAVAYNIMSDESITPVIQFETPAPSSTLPDFRPWVLSGYNFTPGALYFAEVAYNEVSSTFVYVDSTHFYASSSFFYFNIPKNNQLGNGFSFNANALLFFGTSTDPIAEATTTFNIASTTPPFVPAPSCDFTSSSFLGDPVGNIKQGICGAFIWAFFPSASQQADLGAHLAALQDAVKNKPPFGYFTAITSSLGSLQTTSTPSSTLLTSSGSSVFSGAFGALDMGLASILWVLFAWYIFHRMKNIQL